MVNVFKFIKSQKIDATICKSERERDGNKVTRVVNSAYDKDAAMFPKQWSEFLLDGMTGVFDTIRDTNGHVKINQKYKNVKLYDRINRDIFTQAAAFLADVK